MSIIKITSYRDNQKELRSAARLKSFATFMLIFMVVQLVTFSVSSFIPKTQAGSELTNNFPRLGIWNPVNNGNGNLAERARYDVVSLMMSDVTTIPDLRAANPDITILLYTNIVAREVPYFTLTGSEVDPTNYSVATSNPLAMNYDISVIPVQWILKQGGSTLSADINASVTTIPVTDGTKFRAGEIAVIGTELMYIDNVVNNNLSVHRGYYKAATTHTSGDLLASALSAYHTADTTWGVSAM